MSYEPLSRELANRVWDVLVASGAIGIDSVRQRESFVDIESAEYVTEYRFQGVFGFGGKLWRTHDGGFRVSYYPEDRTPPLDKILLRVNEALAKLKAPTNPQGSKEPGGTGEKE